jgi:glycosyltransferase involved in cell wall biosynthesis
MKILHLNTSDITGGAARAAYRLHRSLLDQGVDSQMLVQSKASDDRTVIGPESKIGKGMGRIRPTLDQLPNRLYPRRKQTPYHASWLPFSGIIRKIRAIDPDIVHVHWIAGGYLRIEDLAKIQKPIVWSLHDMWAFTGGCHYDGVCGRYQECCGACPVLGSAKNKDLSQWVFRRKHKQFFKVPNLTVNGLSSWLADCATSSSLFQDRKVVNLPNPIDTQVYAPMPKTPAKQILGLAADKKYVLFGAMNATGDERKGFDELTQALGLMSGNNIELVIFGSSDQENAPSFPFRARYLGRLQDDISLRILYSAADVMVVPSKQENLSNAIMEALACGTPVVGFDIGGTKDMIEHQQNGYLAQSFDPQDLAAGIAFCLDQAVAPGLRDKARSKVVNTFAAQLVANHYLTLYENVLNGA